MSMKSPSDPADLRASLSLALGAAYILDRELESGGTARVFIAYEESIDGDVMIVVIAEALTRDVDVERFHAELRRASRLDEQHTVPVLSVGRTAGGLHYYTMPFVPGHSLRHRIEQGPVGFDESVAVLRDVARAMAYAHGEGFVHRHLIPENVLLPRGGAAVTDFGLARALEQSGARAPDALLTHSSYTALAYVAPELAAGDLTTDHRADIYAWGVMAYELLLDADPFADVTTPAQTDASPTIDVSPLQLFKRHGVPEQLALLVMRCCEYDPAARPESALELVSTLERIPDRASTLALQRRSAARLVGTSIIAALVLFVATGMAVWKMQKRESRVAPLVAVLPFDISGTPADSLFAHRVSDATSARLSKLAGLRVIDLETVRSITDSARGARAIGKALGADYVLRASMSQERMADGTGRIRVRPLLLRVADGTTRWTGGPVILSSVHALDMPNVVATKTADELNVYVSPDYRTAHHLTTSSAAFSAFALGEELYRRNTAHALPLYEQALRAYEQAYGVDPRYADAIGGAALALARMGQAGAHPAHYDSALALAGRALGIEHGQARALDAGALIAVLQNRTDDAHAWLDRALSANPSDLEALALRAELLPLIGDSIGTWRDIERLVSIGGRSVDALVAAATSAQSYRRFTEAGEFLQRARQLDPDRIDLVVRVARLGRAEGNFQRMARTVREFRRRGGSITAEDLTLLRVGDEMMRNELAESSPGSFGIVSRADSVTHSSQKALLFLARRNTATARALFDSSAVLLRRLLADTTLAPSERRRYVDLMAWTDAARGERRGALAVATGMERDPITLQWPNGQLAAGIACNSAEIYAFVDDVPEMINQLRRCLTLPGGYAPNAISAEPALWRHAIDPRLRALLGEFKLEVRRKEQ